MKYLFFILSFLFFAVVSVNNQQVADAPGETLCVVDNVTLDTPTTSVEVDLIAELKLLDQGSTIVVPEGISPPGVKPLMIIENNKLKFKESTSVVINPTEKDADTTTENPGYKLLKNLKGLSSGGSAGNPTLRA